MLKTIVVVDDNKATNFIHKKFILKAECAEEVLTFQEGLKAIEYLKQSSQYPELIFVDINMPTMDAWEFLNHYNELKPQDNSDTKVVLLTTSLSPGDNEKIKNFPIISEVVLKPLAPDLIKRVVEKYF